MVEPGFIRRKSKVKSKEILSTPATNPSRETNPKSFSFKACHPSRALGQDVSSQDKDQHPRGRGSPGGTPNFYFVTTS